MFDKLKILSSNELLAFLKANSKPHYFGLGFIQAKVTDNIRLHFWHPDISSIVPEEEIHNHRYDFTSYIYKGAITNIEYDFFMDYEYSNFEKVSVSCKPNQSEEPQRIAQGFITERCSYTLSQGSEYKFKSNYFHKIKATTAITILQRDEIVSDYAHVIRPITAPYVCPFSKSLTEDECWKYIEYSLES